MHTILTTQSQWMMMNHLPYLEYWRYVKNLKLLEINIYMIYIWHQRFGSGSGSTRIHCIWPDPDPLQSALIWIHFFQMWIPGSGSGSMSKWDGSETLVSQCHNKRWSVLKIAILGQRFLMRYPTTHFITRTWPRRTSWTWPLSCQRRNLSGKRKDKIIEIGI